MSTWQDLSNNPRLKKNYDQRVAIIKLIREFFWSKDFVETDTPVAVKFPGQEPYLNPLPVDIHDPNGNAEKFYLRTSPEFALKKLLAVGYGRIFELAKCFRDFESFGGNHNTEFTMLEWYRAPGVYGDFMDDMENLFKYVGEKLGVKILKYKDKEINFSEKWDRLSMKEVWHKFAGINLDECLDLAGISVAAENKGYKVSESDLYEDVFFKIFLNEIETKLGLERPLFIYDYPAQMTSLSRLCEDTRYAERVECYVGGLEMCNGYGELTDAKQQKLQLEKDKSLRAKLGKEIWPIDNGFISALDNLPATAQRATAGVAMGVDRMVLLFTGAKDLNEVIFGAVKDQLDA